MGRIRKTLALHLAAPTFLAGCVTQPPVDYEAIARQSEATKARTEACIDNVRRSRIYRDLNRRLVLFPGHDPLAERKTWIRGLLTPQEKADLRAWMPLIRQCRAIRVEGARAMSEEMAGVLEQSHADLDALYTDLLNDRMSINSFNARVIEENAATFGRLRSLQEDLYARSVQAQGRRSTAAGPR
ncbi:MAG: hypothetical protein PVF91_11035 [Chromatiales bacterium]|jgi:hypothetical protein